MKNPYPDRPILHQCPAHPDTIDDITEWFEFNWKFCPFCGVYIKQTSEEKVLKIGIDAGIFEMSDNAIYIKKGTIMLHVKNVGLCVSRNKTNIAYIYPNHLLIL